MRKVGKFTESVARILEADETPELLTEEQAKKMVGKMINKENALSDLFMIDPEITEKSDRFIFQYKLYVAPNLAYALIFKNLFCKITIRKTTTKEKQYSASISFDYEHPDGGGNGIFSDTYFFNTDLDIVDVRKA